MYEKQNKEETFSYGEKGSESQCFSSIRIVKESERVLFLRLADVRETFCFLLYFDLSVCQSGEGQGDTRTEGHEDRNGETDEKQTDCFVLFLFCFCFVLFHFVLFSFCFVKKQRNRQIVR